MYIVALPHRHTLTLSRSYWPPGEPQRPTLYNVPNTAFTIRFMTVVQAPTNNTAALDVILQAMRAAATGSMAHPRDVMPFQRYLADIQNSPSMQFMYLMPDDTFTWNDMASCMAGFYQFFLAYPNARYTATIKDSRGRSRGGGFVLQLYYG